MKKLLISTFLFPVALIVSGQGSTEDNAFSWEKFGSEVDRFIDQASTDGFTGWKGDFVGNGPMGLFEAFACTEPFLGGTGVLYKNPLGGYEFVIALQVEEPTALETPSTSLQENYGYFTQWLGMRGTNITTRKGEGYVGFSKIHEGASLSMEETLQRKWAALGFAIAYETSYVLGEGDKFQYGLVLTITSGYVEGEEQPTEPTTEDPDNFDWLLYGDEEEEE
jgi:hypothetical protein